MSYTFLAAAGEESSAASFSAIPAYVLSRLNLTAAKSCCNGNETASCPSSPSGTMCEPLTASRGEDELMLSVEGSRAKTLVLQAKVEDLMGNDLACGVNLEGYFAKYNLDLRLWKTRQLSLFEEWEESLGTWPRWGFMRDGVSWALPTPALFIYENESGYVPTCRKQYRPSQDRNGKESENYHSNLEDYLGAKKPWPRLSEVMMAWPIGWTSETEHVETAKFQQWLNSHGKP